MKFTVDLIDWQARAPGLSEQDQWRSWSQHNDGIDPSAPQAKTSLLPMMTARRLSSGSKLAVECGLTIMARQQVDGIVFTSRHGELERNYRILEALATRQAISPTDFAMSVHNSAVGSLTIAARQPLVSSSVSAGVDTFQQGLYEVQCLLQGGYQRVLMVDFDGVLPDFYHPRLPATMPTWAYACALVFTAGNTLTCTGQSATTSAEPSLPQSLQFLRHYLRNDARFTLAGDQRQWQWCR